MLDPLQRQPEQQINNYLLMKITERERVSKYIRGLRETLVSTETCDGHLENGKMGLRHFFSQLG